jgi:hypothetical protein
MNLHFKQGIKGLQGAKNLIRLYIYIYIYIERERERERDLCKVISKTDNKGTSPRSLPSVPSKSITRVQGSIPAHLAIQIPLVV